MNYVRFLSFSPGAAKRIGFGKDKLVFRLEKKTKTKHKKLAVFLVGLYRGGMGGEGGETYLLTVYINRNLTTANQFFYMCTQSERLIGTYPIYIIDSPSTLHVTHPM